MVKTITNASTILPQNTNQVLYHTLNREYPKADELLKQINHDYPQMGDYRWLNQPIYDRIKKGYPQFLETINQLRLPPKIADSNLLRM